MLEELYAAAAVHHEWRKLLPQLCDTSIGIHVSVMVEPFLSLLFSGQKTIESRFSRHAIAPYNKVSKDDLVFIKAGPIVGCFRVASAQFIRLEGDALNHIRERYAAKIGAEDDEFWQAQVSKQYATLIGVKDVHRLPTLGIAKRDRRGWVVLR